MSKEFEDFINSELPKRISIRTPATEIQAGKIPVTVGNGLEVVLKSPDDVLLRASDAYEVAVRNGFEGTEVQWLEGLNGKDGDNEEVLATLVLAKEAADSADLSAGIAAGFSKPFTTKEEGILGTSGTGATNRFFSVPLGEPNIAIIYRNDNGVAVELGGVAGSGVVDKLTLEVKARALAHPRKNLFNVTDPDVTLNSFPKDADGKLQATPDYNTTGYILVEAGKKYTLSKKHYVAWYGQKKQFISGTTGSNTAVTLTAPAGAVYLRCSARIGVDWNLFQVEAGDVQTAYEVYKFDVALTDDVVKNQNLADGAVSADKTDFIKIGKNLFDKSAATIGFFINPMTAALTANVLFDTTAKIKVTPGTAYVMSHGIRFSSYTAADGTTPVPGGLDDNTQLVTAFVPPAGAEYVRISLSHARLDAFQVEVGTVSTNYYPYGYQVFGPNGEQLEVPPLGKGSIGTEELKNAAVNAEKTDFIKIGKNLYNKATAQIGFFINPTSGAMASSASFDTCSNIKVTPGVQYSTSNGIRFSCYFRADGQTVVGGGINDNQQLTSSFTPPASAEYVRISFGHALLNTFQVEEGALPTAYEEYGYQVTGPNGEKLLMPNASVKSLWSGKRWGSLGDSITEQAKWQAYVAAQLGLIWSNFGKGGTKLSGPEGDVNAMCQDARIDAMPLNLDLINVMPGTNDWAQSVDLGDPNSNDPLTFNGAFNTLALKLMTRFPTKRVIIFTTPYGELPGKTLAQGWVNTYTNSKGLTTRDYAEAIKAGCRRWSLPCADVNSDAGWNTVNIRTFITDDGGLLHPNDTGGRRIAEVAIAGFQKIAPLSN